MRNGFIARRGWEFEYCPFCCEKLELKEFFQRKIKKVCKCKKCGRKIDERVLHL